MNDDTKNMLNQLNVEMTDTIFSKFEDYEAAKIAPLYSNYVYKNYYNFIHKNRNLDDVKRIILIIEKSKWNTRSKEKILSELVDDEYFKKLSYLYQLSLDLAIKRATDDNLKPTISVKESQNNIDIMVSLLEKVEAFNVDFSKKYISEAMLNYAYACGLTNTCSLEVGNYYGRK